MELYFKTICDITYMSEFVPHHFLKKCLGLSQKVNLLLSIILNPYHPQKVVGDSIRRRPPLNNGGLQFMSLVLP